MASPKPCERTENEKHTDCWSIIDLGDPGKYPGEGYIGLHVEG